MTKYDVVIDDDGSSVITIFAQGETIVVTQEHPNFTRFLRAVVDGDEDPGKYLSMKHAISFDDERVVVDEEAGVVYFNGEPVHNALARTIVRYARERRDNKNLVKFMENLESNPSRRSREQLFQWVSDRDLVIDEDGYFIGYKGVRADGFSSHAGGAFVNGEWVDGHVPNEEGSIISMPRENVQDDPNVACSFGLHVGTYGYASSFGARLLEVRVNPADVVSVPSDSGGAKLRCCEYEVLKLHEVPGDDVSHWEPEENEEDVQALTPYIPQGWLEKLRARIKNKNVTE